MNFLEAIKEKHSHVLTKIGFVRNPNLSERTPLRPLSSNLNQVNATRPLATVNNNNFVVTTLAAILSIPQQVVLSNNTFVTPHPLPPKNSSTVFKNNVTKPLETSESMAKHQKQKTIDAIFELQSGEKTVYEK